MFSKYTPKSETIQILTLPQISASLKPCNLTTIQNFIPINQYSLFNPDITNFSQPPSETNFFKPG